MNLMEKENEYIHTLYYSYGMDIIVNLEVLPYTKESISQLPS